MTSWIATARREWPIWACIIGVCLALVLAGNLSRSEEQHQRDHQQAEAPSSEQSNAKPVVLSKSESNTAERDSDPKHDRNQRYGVWDRLLAPFDFFDKHNGSFSALAAIAVAIFTFLLLRLTRVQLNTAIQTAGAAESSAKVARDTLIAAQRPWIEVTKVVVAGPLMFEPTPDDHEGCIKILVHVRNVGNAPAVRIQLNMRLTISNTVDLRSEQRTYSDAIQKGRELAAVQPSIVQPEITLFPNATAILETVAWMNSEPLAKFREWCGRNPGAIAFPAIVGCVHYEFTFANGHYQTGIIYGLHKSTPYYDGHPRPKYSTVPPDYPSFYNVPGAVHMEGVVPASDLLLVQNLVGTGPIT